VNDIRNTRPSQNQRTPIVHIRRPSIFIFLSGRFDVPGDARETVETHAKEKNVTCFSLDEVCLDCRRRSAQPHHRVVGEQNIGNFAPATEDSFENFQSCSVHLHGLAEPP